MYKALKSLNSRTYRFHSHRYFATNSTKPKTENRVFGNVGMNEHEAQLKRAMEKVEADTRQIYQKM